MDRCCSDPADQSLVDIVRRHWPRTISPGGRRSRAGRSTGRYGARSVPGGLGAEKSRIQSAKGNRSPVASVRPAGGCGACVVSGCLDVAEARERRERSRGRRHQSTRWIPGRRSSTPVSSPIRALAPQNVMRSISVRLRRLARSILRGRRGRRRPGARIDARASHRWRVGEDVLGGRWLVVGRRQWGRAPVVSCPPQDRTARDHPAADQDEAGGSSGVGGASAVGFMLRAGTGRTTLLRFGGWRRQGDGRDSEDEEPPWDVSQALILVSISHGPHFEATALAFLREQAVAGARIDTGVGPRHATSEGRGAGRGASARSPHRCRVP